MKKKGCLIVVSGASGTGKGTVCQMILKRRPSLKYSISATTRPPRDGETDGVEYYFYSQEKFQSLIAADGFLEWAEVYGNYYGTPKAPVDERLENGEDVLLEIDTQGALNVMKMRPDGVFIFLLPPSLTELERRIRGRGLDAEAAIRRRLAAARDEIRLAEKYQYAVVNDEIDRAANTIEAIITAEHAKTKRQDAIFTDIF